MSVEFKVYDTPQPTSRKKKALSHARLVTSGTKGMDLICKVVSQFTSLSSSDIKAVLDAMSNYVAMELKNGYNVELEGIGHFSIALSSKQKRTKEDGSEVVNVKIDGVNFRCDAKLKKAVKEGSLHQTQTKMLPMLPTERKTRMFTYITTYGYINVSLYAEANQCSYYLAKKELIGFVAEGLLIRVGSRNHEVYQPKV